MAETVGETVGVTVGVEEEFHLVDPETCELRSVAALSQRADDGLAGPGLRAELLTSQLEAVTGVCEGLAELGAEVRAARHTAASVASEHGVAILATSTHPFALLSETEVAHRPRYRVLQERFGAVVGQLNLTGCHVHVGVPDQDVAVAIMNHARPHLPVLAALTGSSPFHEGSDTGFDSFRLSQLALWPQGGLPPRLESAAHYRETVAQLVRTGLVDDPTMVLWELRPSDRYPTLEFRIADVCTCVEDVTLYAGLVRSLVRVLAERVNAGEPEPRVDEVVLRAARWRAARYGLSGELWSFGTSTLAPAATVVGELWTELDDDLTAHGEAAVLKPLLDDLLDRGTSATRQREVFASSRDLREVVRDGLRRTMQGVNEPIDSAG